MSKRPISKDTICWSCKRATNPDGCTCPWAQDGIPVPGWEAEKGYVFQIPVDGTDKRITSQSYTVLNCPLYIRDNKYLTITEVIDMLAKYFECQQHSIYVSLERRLKQYERETGEKIPTWIKYYLQDKKEKIK